jgi:hypothetical protein
LTSLGHRETLTLRAGDLLRDSLGVALDLEIGQAQARWVRRLAAQVTGDLHDVLLAQNFICGGTAKGRIIVEDVHAGPLLQIR